MTLIREDPQIPIGDTVEVCLPNEATAAGQARRSVRVTLNRWRLPSLIDACVLAVSELVTNALRHGRPPLGMLLSRRARDVRLEVHDSGSRPMPAPHTGDEGELAESGRGLEILRAVTDDSGSEHVAGDGKTVFASWHVGGEPPT